MKNERRKMGYALSVKLRADAPIEKIEPILLSRFQKLNGFKWFSSVSDEHTYSPKYMHGFSLSYRSLSVEDHEYVNVILCDIAEKYGLKELDPRSNIEFPCYYYDNEVNFIVKKSVIDNIDTSEYTFKKEGESYTILTSEDEENLTDEDFLDENVEYTRAYFEPFEKNIKQEQVESLVFLQEI